MPNERINSAVLMYDVVTKDISFLQKHARTPVVIMMLLQLSSEIQVVNFLFESLVNNVKSIAPNPRAQMIIIESNAKSIMEHLKQLHKLRINAFSLLHDSSTYFDQEVTPMRRRIIEGHVEECFYELIAKTYAMISKTLTLSTVQKESVHADLQSMLSVNTFYKNHIENNQELMSKFNQNLSQWGMTDAAFTEHVKKLQVDLHFHLSASPSVEFFSFDTVPVIRTNNQYFDPSHKYQLMRLCSAILDEDIETSHEILSIYPDLLTVSFKDELMQMHDLFPGQTERFVFTPLSFAAFHCKLSAMNILLDEYNINPSLMDDLNGTPLHHLLEVDRGGYHPESLIYQSALLLVNKGASIDESRSAIGIGPFWPTVRELANKNAPSFYDLLFTGMKDINPGANCRAAISTKQPTLNYFQTQLQRNIRPLASAAALAGTISFVRSKMS